MLLEQLKYDNQMEHVANQLMEIIPHVGIHSTRLKEIFTLTVVLNTAKPTSDLGWLVDFLEQKGMFHPMSRQNCP
jgi:hypothetical protein